MSDDNFTTGRSAGRERASDVRPIIQVAEWRLERTPLVLAVLNYEGPMIYPPIAGHLPGYVVRIDNESDRASFMQWLGTLTPGDRGRAEEALMLNAQGIPTNTITRRLAR